MHLLASLCLAGVMLLATHASTAQASENIFSNPYTMVDLDNGLRVIVVKTDYPDVVAMHIPVQTGARNEVEAGKTGFAHFFEHMMFRGTKQYPKQRYIEAMKQAGADQNAYTSDDYTNYHLTFTKADLEKMIAIEADRFQNLSYSEEQFRTEALAVKGEYLKNFSNPLRKLYAELRGTAYEQHTYKHTPMGFLRDIEDMPNQLSYSKTFFDRWYRPEKTSVIIVGDVEVDKTIAWVKQYWGGWKRGDYQVKIPQESAPKGPKYKHVAWDAPTQPWIAIAFHGPAFDPAQKAMPALELLSQVYFSETSPLYQRLIEQERVIDQLYADFSYHKDPGLLIVAARLTDVKHAARVRDAMLRTVAEAQQKTIDADKLAQLKAHLRYSFIHPLDNSEAIAETLAQFVHFERTPETLNTLYRTFDALTPEDVQVVAKQYLTDDRRITITLAQAPSLPGFDKEPKLSDYAAAAMTTAQFKWLDKTSDNPLIDVMWLWRTGTVDEPSGKRGLAALTALMIAEAGSAKHSYADLKTKLYPLASNLNWQVDKEMTVFRSRIHKDNAALWYPLIKPSLLDPGWREEDFVRIKTQLENAIRTDLKANNDEELAKEVLYAAIYHGGHPYGSYNLGLLEDIQGISLPEVKQFYREHYTQKNLTLAITGAVPSDLKKEISKDFLSLPTGDSQAMAVPPPPALKGHHAVIVQKETPATAVSLGFPIPIVRGHKDWVALWLVSSWLGEHRSSQSYLYQRIRELRGMNYGDYSYIEYFPRGMYQFHADPNLARSQQIFQVWLRPLRTINDAHFATRVAIFELQKLVNQGLTEKQFEDTRRYLQKFVGLLLKSQGDRLGYALDSEYYKTAEFADYVRQGLERLTLQDVNRVIKQYLQVDNVQFVFVTKEAEALRQRLIKNEPSLVTYNSEKPKALLDEDAIIAKFPLAMTAQHTIVLPLPEIFKCGCINYRTE